jgi:hypothetical protein
LLLVVVVLLTFASNFILKFEVATTPAVVVVVGTLVLSLAVALSLVLL